LFPLPPIRYRCYTRAPSRSPGIKRRSATELAPLAGKPASGMGDHRRWRPPGEDRCQTYARPGPPSPTPTAYLLNITAASTATPPGRFAPSPRQERAPGQPDLRPCLARAV